MNEKVYALKLRAVIGLSHKLPISCLPQKTQKV